MNASPTAREVSFPFSDLWNGNSAPVSRHCPEDVTEPSGRAILTDTLPRKSCRLGLDHHFAGTAHPLDSISSESTDHRTSTHDISCVRHYPIDHSHNFPRCGHSMIRGK